MSDNTKKTYEQGIIDGVKLWGDVCKSKENCDRCPIQDIAGANVTCAQFASKFPEKTVSLMQEMHNEDYTYFNEYVTRFPNCTLTVDELAQCACRKALFEGYVECDAEDSDACVKCWKETYSGDITEIEQTEPDEAGLDVLGSSLF